MSKEFFTQYNQSKNDIYLTKKFANFLVCRSDLELANKKTTYAGKPRYQYENIFLYPFSIEVDFTLNERYTLKEKERLCILTKGKTVHLIGVYSQLKCKHGCPSKSCAGGDFLTAQKILKKQKGLRGNIGDLFYSLSDKKLFDFFETRGYKSKFKIKTQPDRISFTKRIYNDSQANKVYDDLYDFDTQYSPTGNSTRFVLIEKQEKEF